MVIDSTAQYIHGDNTTDKDVSGTEEQVQEGLQVVTVLIGVFDKTDGKPVMGVINQPFANYNPTENK